MGKNDPYTYNQFPGADLVSARIPGGDKLRPYSIRRGDGQAENPQSSRLYIRCVL